MSKNFVITKEWYWKNKLIIFSKRVRIHNTTILNAQEYHDNKFSSYPCGLASQSSKT